MGNSFRGLAGVEEVQRWGLNGRRRGTARARAQGAGMVFIGEQGRAGSGQGAWEGRAGWPGSGRGKAGGHRPCRQAPAGIQRRVAAERGVREDSPGEGRITAGAGRCCSSSRSGHGSLVPSAGQASPAKWSCRSAMVGRGREGEQRRKREEEVSRSLT